MSHHGTTTERRRSTWAYAMGLTLAAAMLSGCTKKLIGVNVYVIDDKTRLEQEVLGTYDVLGGSTQYVQSVWVKAEPDAKPVLGDMGALEQALRDVKDALEKCRAMGRKRSPIDECRLLLNIGALQSSLKQWAKALTALAEADSLAQKYRLVDIRWKVALEFALARFHHRGDRGVLLKDMRAAAQLLDNAPPMVCRDDGPSRRARASLFSWLAMLESENGRGKEALLWLERHASRETLHALGGAHAVLTNASERESLDMVLEAGNDLQQAANRLASHPPDDPNLPSLANEFDDALATYNEAVGQAAESSSALGAVLSSNPPPFVEVQDTLAEDTALLRCAQIGRRLIVWVLRPEEFTWKASSAPWAFLRSASPQEIAKAVLDPVAEALEGVRRLYVLVDDRTIDLPWYEAPWKGNALIASMQVGFETGLSHHVSAYERRNLFRRSLLICAPPGGFAELLKGVRKSFRAVTVVDETSPQTKSLALLVRRHNCSLLPQTLRVNRRQVLQSYVEIGGTRSPTSPTLRAIVAGPMSSSVLFVGSVRPLEGYGDVDTRTIGAVAVLAAQAGCPSLVTRRRPPTGPLPCDVLAAFLKAVAVQSTGEALRAARNEALKRGAPPEDWTCLRIYGSLGMNEDEALEFADEYYEKYGELAVEAQDEGRWEDVVRYCEAALDLVDVIELDEGRSNFYDALSLANYKLARYDEAAKWQR
ncbi:MAG TPA: hypothetical protein EYP14_10510, partial [Planctomycetaceae bacterium]|nr:hypothetical protein [Planctomycetaceae bacterium]